MVWKLPSAISRVMRKNFPDAQKLSGWQCHDATMVFGPLARPPPWRSPVHYLCCHLVNYLLDHLLLSKKSLCPKYSYSGTLSTIFSSLTTMSNTSIASWSTPPRRCVDNFDTFSSCQQHWVFFSQLPTGMMSCSSCKQHWHVIDYWQI